VCPSNGPHGENRNGPTTNLFATRTSASDVSFTVLVLRCSSEGFWVKFFDPHRLCSGGVFLATNIPTRPGMSHCKDETPLVVPQALIPCRHQVCDGCVRKLDSKCPHCRGEVECSTSLGHWNTQGAKGICNLKEKTNLAYKQQEDKMRKLSINWFVALEGIITRTLGNSPH
jgi:hypothetical protein